MDLAEVLVREDVQVCRPFARIIRRKRNTDCERILSLSHPRGVVSADDDAGEQDDDVGSEGQMKCARGKSGRGRDFWHPVSHLDTRRICRN